MSGAERQELPEAWAAASVLHLAELLRGVSYAKGEAETQPREGLLPIVRANNIDGELTFDDLQHVPSIRVSDAQRLRRGDVVVAMSSGSKSVVGKAASVRSDWPGGFGAFCGVLRSVEGIDPFYFGLFFQSSDYRQAISESSSGTNINNLRRDHFAAIEVPLPPLAEQRRIVAKVESLLARVQILRQQLDHVPQVLKRFRRAVLNVACRGSLSSSSSIPLKNAIEGLEQGWSPKCEIEPSASEDVWGVIKTTAIQPLQFRAEENKRLPDELKPRPGLEIRSGDILITRAGPRVRAGVTCYVPEVRKRLILCDKAYRFRAKAGVAEGRYLAIALNAPDILDEIEEMKTGISDSGVNLTQRKFLDLEIPLPSLDMQQEIVRRVDALFALADAIERRVAAASSRADRLTQAILAKAFRGELVPTEAELARAESRDYETAEQLLERIRSEQGASPQRKRGRRSRQNAET